MELAKGTNPFIARSLFHLRDNAIHFLNFLCLLSRVWVERHVPLASTVFTLSLFKSEAEVLMLFTTEDSEVSSANNLASLVRP